MNKLLITAAATLLASGVASAAEMYIDVGTNSYDAGRLGGAIDANTETATFTEFGFSQLLATSIYDYSDGSTLGTVTDTNDPALLLAAGIPTSGTALDGSTTVTLVAPNCPAGQCDIDALSPLVPPINGSDSEGFLSTWDLQVEYNFDGTLTPGGPVYTGGTLDIFFNDIFDDSNDRLVITATLTGSTIAAANLDLFFDITFAEAGFLFIDDGSGTFKDAADGGATFALDTNVNPPIPTADQLLLVGDNAIRQTTLDGSITGEIPEPATLALFGIGVLGLGAAARKRKAL